MKKITATTIFILIFGAIQAQTLDYTIDCPKPDSCYLREISTAAPTAQEPRPQTTISNRLFRSLADLDAVIEAVRKQAREEAAKGMELLRKSETMNAVADKIKAAKDAQTATAQKKN